MSAVFQSIALGYQAVLFLTISALRLSSRNEKAQSIGPIGGGLELREDGGHEIREDGGLELRE